MNGSRKARTEMDVKVLLWEMGVREVKNEYMTEGKERVGSEEK